MDINRKMTFRRSVVQLPSAPRPQKLREFAARPAIETVALARDNQFLYICKKGQLLSLRNGMRTMAAILGVNTAGLSVLPVIHPDKWLQQHWDDEDPGNMEQFPFHSGPLMDPDSLRAIKTVTKGKEGAALRNMYIGQHSVQESIESGVITHEQAGRVQDGKDLVAAEEEERNPDLVVPLPWTFSHRRQDDESGVGVPTGEHPDVEVTIVPRPDITTTFRRKHYWIYSDASGFGKTFFLDKMEEHYNASVVGDKNNMTGISERSQFLLFDERHALPELQTMKALTSGRSTVTMNRKTYGRSFRPRTDVQLLICGNQSPYEVYGTFCPKMQRRYMDSNLRDQLEQRFFIIKLDGDVAADRTTFSDPISWTPEEYGAAACSAFYDTCSDLNDADELDLRSVKRALYKAMKVHERRAGTRLTTVRAFLRFLIAHIRPIDVPLLKYALDGSEEVDDLKRFTGTDRIIVHLGRGNRHLHDPIPPSAPHNYFPR